jgi:hypothetical protein
MATIQRNVKTFGTRSFVSEVSAAPSNYAPVLSNEVDADLDTVYAAWNGGTDTVNLKDLSVTTPKLADAAVTSAKIAANLPGSLLAADSITAREIGGDAVGNTELASGILGSKLADNTVPYAKLILVEARVRQSGALPSIPHNVNTALTFDTEMTDVGGLFNPAQPDGFTVQQDGYYLFGGSAAFASSGTGTRRALSLTVGGTSVAGSEASQGAVRQLSVSSGAALLTGAKVQLFAFQDSGFGLSLDVGVLPNLWIVRVG